jgi:hypothetical protein
MNPIPLDAEGCRSAILDYRRRLRLLTALVRDAGHLDELHPAHDSLAALRIDLDADVRGRSTLEGQARMSGVEARVLEPALRQARIALSFPTKADGGAWVTRLQAADACLLVALSQLNGPPAWTSMRQRRTLQRVRPSS